MGQKLGSNKGLFMSILFYLHSKMTLISLRVQKYWPWQEAFFSLFHVLGNVKW
jgi:hypothetical protein